MEYTITSSQQQFFQEKGYLILRDVLSPSQTTSLQSWAQEVHDLPRTSETPWMPYEEINSKGQRVLCRTENYAKYHSEFNKLLRGEKLLGILGQLAGEDMLLFKEKSEFELILKSWNGEEG
jgi:2-aminoethylphosphonate dioxygenase